LYWYSSRWYDSQLAHFTQPDTIIPDVGSSKSYDRYSYVENNPVNLKDPSGHLACSDAHVAEGDCSDEGVGLWRFTNVSFNGNWSKEEEEAIRSSVVETGIALASVMDGDSTPWEAFAEVFGEMEYSKFDKDSNGNSGYCTGMTANGITCYSGEPVDPRLFTHELGHVFSHAYADTPYTDLEGEKIVDSKGNWIMGTHDNGIYQRTTRGYPSDKEPTLYHDTDWADFETNAHDDYADMFMNWVYGTFDYSALAYNAGVIRDNWMTTNVASYINSGR